MKLLDKFRHKLLWWRHIRFVDELFRLHPLQYLFLEVTRRCNLACVYCGSSCTGKEKQGELSVKEWIEVIRQIAEDFEPRKVMVAVTGGEPLIKDGILDLFREIHRLGFPFGMVTNGLLLDQAMAKELVASGIGSISISMDAPPEINDKLRGKGSGAKVVQALRNLREAGYKGKLEIISTLTKQSLYAVDAMRSFVAALRVPQWRVAPVMPIGRAVQNRNLVPDAKDIRWLLEYVYHSRKDGMLPLPEFSEEGFVGFRFEGMVRPYLCQCRAGITVGGIKCDGKIGACPELSEAFDQGDIRFDRFKTVWEERYQILRDRSWTKKGQCAHCPHYKICRGGAMHLYPEPGSEFLRCVYLFCKEAESQNIGKVGLQHIEFH